MIKQNTLYDISKKYFRFNLSVPNTEKLHEM